ncbi:MAG: hypothetical protein AB8G22_06090 [Saprospiraceae bacterium]
MKIRGEIQKLIKRKKFARVTRKYAKGRSQIERGYFLKASKELAILQECDDFQLEGSVVFPIEQIEKIRYNRNDAFYDKIVTKEGLKTQLRMNVKVDISDWVSLFTEFKENQKGVIIECESRDFSDFLIGKIVKISKKKVWIHNFNAQGRLDGKPSKIKLKNITRVTFNDRYIEVFEKYVK